MFAAVLKPRLTLLEMDRIEESVGVSPVYL
jgi:hypothetical protein